MNNASCKPLSDAEQQPLVQASYNDESVSEFENHIGDVTKSDTSDNATKCFDKYFRKIVKLKGIHSTVVLNSTILKGYMYVLLLTGKI